MGREKKSAGPAAMPSIHSYLDHALFLRDAFQFRKRTDKLTLAKLQKRLDLSPTFLSFIFNGKYPCSEELALKLAVELGVSAKQRAFLARLAAYNHETNPQSKANILRELGRAKQFASAHNLDLQHLDLFEHWLNLVLLEMASNGLILKDIEAANTRLAPKVSIGTVRTAVDTLQRLGLVRLDGTAVESLQRTFETPDEIEHQVITALHMQMAELGLWALEHWPAADRNFGCVIAGTNEAGKREILQKLHDQRKEMFALVDRLSREQPGEQVLTVLYQGFPVTKVPKKSIRKK